MDCTRTHFLLSHVTVGKSHCFAPRPILEGDRKKSDLVNSNEKQQPALSTMF